MTDSPVMMVGVTTTMTMGRIPSLAKKVILDPSPPPLLSLPAAHPWDYTPPPMPSYCLPQLSTAWFPLIALFFFLVSSVVV